MTFCKHIIPSVLCLFITGSNLFADHVQHSEAPQSQYNKVRGKRQVIRSTIALDETLIEIKDLTSDLSANNQQELSEIKRAYKHYIKSLKVQLNDLQTSVSDLRLAPKFRISSCKVIDQDHGGLRDGGGSIIYQKKNDYRACVRASINDKKVSINSVDLIMNGDIIKRLSARGNTQGKNIFEGKAKRFYFQLPKNSRGFTCVPAYATEVQVNYTSRRGFRKNVTLPVDASFINYHGKSKFQVRKCD